jgi:hypothetical protein
MKKKYLSLIVLLIIFGIYYFNHSESPAKPASTGKYDVTIDFPEDRYPKTAAHIKEAIAHGESAICTIERNGADENRKESLAGIDTKTGYDRDEWPMAMCKEGGSGADVEYVPASDNRGAGSWISHQLSDLPDGTKVLIEVQ